MKKNIFNERKLRIGLFFVSYIIRIEWQLLSNILIKEYHIVPEVFSSLGSVLTSGFLFACTLLVNFSSIKHKIFHNKVLSVFMSGMYLWGVFGLFCALVHLTPASYREILSSFVFTASIILSARTIIIYDLLRPFMRLNIICLGTTLLILYILKFDGLQFLNPDTLKSIFMSGNRYRYAFGIGHVNGLGVVTAHFILWFAIYKQILHKEKFHDRLYSYFSMICIPVAWIMLLSSASRSNITGIILFWMVFYFINSYQKLRPHIRVIFVMLNIVLALTVIFVVDWEFIYTESNRALNFIMLPNLDKNNLFWVGSGINGSYSEGGIIDKLDLIYLDNYYLWVFCKEAL